jgi:hypothetical protein
MNVLLLIYSLDGSVTASAGEERRRAARTPGVENKSSRATVLAREGRGGGVMLLNIPFLLTTWARESTVVALAEKGSCSIIWAVAVADVRLCLRARGLGFGRELRTKDRDNSGGVFDRTEDD